MDFIQSVIIMISHFMDMNQGRTKMAYETREIVYNTNTSEIISDRNVIFEFPM